MSVHTSLRIPYNELQALKANAANHGLTFTEYMIRAGLQDLPDNSRLAQLEHRLEALERWRQNTLDSQGDW